MKTDGATKAGEILGQVSGKTVETMTVWAEANQRVLRELVDLSVGAAKEGVRLYAELQQGAPKDPMAWYQKALVETVDSAQKFFRLLEGNAQAVTRSAERMHGDGGAGRQGHPGDARGDDHASPCFTS